MTFFDDAANSVDRPTQLGKDLEFWRKEPPIVSESGTIVRGGMLPHQRALWELPNFIKLLVGGYGAGKTSVGCKRLISMALENAPVPVAAVSPSFQMARRTVIQTVSEYLQGKASVYGRKFFWRYNNTLHEFKIFFAGREATILICSGDRPISLRGPNLGGAYIDEPFIQDVDVFTQMIARVRHPAATHREIVLTGTPETLNWGYDLAFGEMSARNDVGIVQASTRQNYCVPADYVGKLEGVFTDKAAEAYIEGRFVNLSKGQVYYAFDPLESVVDLPMPAYATLGVGMDFNVNPMAAVVFWHVGKQVHVFAEHELPNADTEYMCQLLRERYVFNERFARSPLQNIYPDASGQQRHSNAPGGRTDFFYIRQAGFTVHAPAKNPSPKDRYNAVNGKLRARDGAATLTISPSCTKLIKYMSVYTHELMNKPDQVAMSHLLDALGYPIAHLFPVSGDHLRLHKLAGL